MRRIPGFFGHQTDRSRGDLSRPNIPMAQCENMTKGGIMPCYKRDYDLLGRFSGGFFSVFVYLFVLLDMRLGVKPFFLALMMLGSFKPCPYS